MKEATVTEVKSFFNMTAAELMPQWKSLSKEEKISSRKKSERLFTARSS